MEKRIFGKCISILHRREQRYMIQQMKEYGIGYSSYNFLMYLSVYEGCSQKEMCREMAVDEALAVRVMKKLQEQGYIQRKKSQENGRRYEIYLTEKGREIIPKLRECLSRWWEQVTEGMPDQELHQVISSVQKMTMRSAQLWKEEEESGQPEKEPALETEKQNKNPKRREENEWKRERQTH